MNRLTNQAIAGDEIDALVAEVCPPALVVSDTAVRQLRPLLEELLRLRKQETPQEAWKRASEAIAERFMKQCRYNNEQAILTRSESSRDWHTKLADMYSNVADELKSRPTPYVAPPLPYQEEKETGR